MFWGVIIVIVMLFDKSGDIPHKMARIWSRFICLVSRTNVTITGMENISHTNTAILVSNHQSFFDIFVLSAYIPIQFRWMAKESLFSIPLVGWGMKACRYIPVDRDDKKKGLKSLIKAVEVLKNGRSVIIFPEGKRAEDNTIGELKKGVLFLAMRTKLPIIPIKINGSREIMKPGSMKISSGKVRVCIDKPINTEYVYSHNKEMLLDEIKGILSQQGD